ncbi:Cap protein [Porcine associated porprismacovirus 6]|uniref:Cap protein n=1 Tax=Porcine associated porprismacovirus 6 TaxID=2170122 RepID=A0A076VE97_9VIRU|nr:Cap protein [Porcine associated porprismacovirus 6]AIK28883.1 Cap protein [Porcine associated porprismacovirus 6]
MPTGIKLALEEGRPTGTGDTGGNPMVTVRVSETYDLSTKVGKMGLVGIHTPTGDLIPRLWSGFVQQYKKFRFVKCDVAMACASMLPADPLQIGVESGSIAPQDMFNPILYKAVSNQSMNNFLGWLQLVGETEDMVGAFNKGSVVDVNNPVFKSAAQDGVDIDQFQMYYSLLADSDGWRKAMPQSGLTMRGLIPLVFQVLSNYGAGPQNESDSADLRISVPALSLGPQGGPPTSAADSSSFVLPRTMRGPAARMPAIDTAFFSSLAAKDRNVFSAFVQAQETLGNVPPAYVGIIVLPPAKLDQLYYRLKVTWTIEFTGVRSNNDLSSWSALANAGNVAYGSDYDVQSKSMASALGMADTAGADITKIMEGS